MWHDNIEDTFTWKVTFSNCEMFMQTTILPLLPINCSRTTARGCQEMRRFLSLFAKLMQRKWCFFPEFFSLMSQLLSDGITNMHNFQYFTYRNSCVHYIQHLQHKFSLNLWIVLLSDHLIAPHELTSLVNWYSQLLVGTATVNYARCNNYN
jgi:hypothetical protein